MSNLNFRSGNRRRMAFYILISLAILVLTARFYRLQILEQNIYLEKSEANSVKKESQIPIRGWIYDRKGVLISDNRPSFSVYVVPALISKNEKAIDRLARILAIKKEKIKRNFRRSRRFQPIKIARHIDLKTLAGLQENKLDLPGVDWKVEPRRNYHFKHSFAHVLGTLGEIDEKELDKNPRYEPGDLVGKKGIEKTLDVELRGNKGFRFVQVDALGRSVGELKNEQTVQPYPGKDLYLTIDSRLQVYADTLMQAHNGALVAIDVNSGEILTLLSKPDYDLSEFTEGVAPDVWQALMADPNKPLFDRATQATYPPGSTYKMVAAVAALNEGIVSPKWTTFCPGYLRIGRRVVHCWKSGGHGQVDLLAAIRGSCNVYFYQLGMKIGIDQWEKYSRLFQFGKRTGVELRGEKSGLVPSKAYYERRYGPGSLTAGMMANIAIGQGELLTTPLQMAQFAMILANSGKYYQPHLRKKLVDKIAKKEESIHYSPKQIKGIKPEVFETVREGMRQVMAGGTGWRASVWRKTGGGKTGTAQNPHGKSHAWFIGFAPFENPEIAIAVFCENGGSGGGVAAPIAGKYLRRYFYYKGEFDYKAEKQFLAKLYAQQKKQAILDSLTNAIPQEIPIRISD